MTQQLLPVFSRRLTLFSALASLTFSSPSFAQSVWTGSTNNEFSEGTNWAPGLPGETDAATVNSGSPQVTNDVTIDQLGVDGGNVTISNTGALTVSNGTTITSGTVGINAGGVLNSDVNLDGGGLAVDGTLNGNLMLNTGNVTVNGALGSATVGTGTALSNNGTVGDVSVLSGGTFDNNSGASAATLTNAGTASNAGTIGSLNNTAGTFTNNTGGTITGTATIAGGTVVNNFVITDADVAAVATFVNNSDGTVGTLVNAGTSSNAGTIGTLTNTAGNFTNNKGGTVTGKTTVSGGTVTNNFVVTDVDVAAVATFVNNSGATAGNVQNAGTVSNAGTIASLQNDAGSFTNNFGGIVTGGTNVSGGSVTNNATLNDVNIGSSGTFTNTTGAVAGAVTNAGNSSNAGTIASLSNTAGSFTNNSGGTITGTTTVSGGTVTNNFVVTDVDVAAVATFVNNSGASAGAVTNSGTTTNAGTIASLQNDGGLFTNNSGGTVSGTTTVDGGTVVNNAALADVDVGAQGTFTNNSGATAGAVSNSGTSANAGTIASLVNSSGSFSNSGTISGTATVTGGELVNDGTVTGTIDIFDGGLLSGSGVSGGLVVNAGGVLSPGPGIQTLAVNGDLTFQAGSIYAVDINSAGASDQVNASGAVTIGGGTLMLRAESGSYGLSTDYTILTASSISGTFSTIDSDFAFLSPSLSYSSTAVDLSLDRNDVRFADVALTANDRATANAVEELGTANTLHSAVLPLNVETAASAFTQLNGEIHPSLKSTFLWQSQFLREAVIAETSQSSARRSTKNGDVSLWASGVLAQNHIGSTGNARGIDNTVTGALVGADIAPLDQWHLGGVLGYSDLSTNPQAAADSYHAGLYAVGDFGPLNLIGGALYSRNDITTRRDIAFSTFTDQLSADYASTAAQVFGDISWTLKMDGIDLQPFANLAFVNLETDDFKERGGAAALSVAGGSDSLAVSTLGLRMSSNLEFGGLPVVASGMIGWRHAAGDTTPVSLSAFEGGSPFILEGVTMPSDTLLVRAGIAARLSRSALLTLTYSGEFARGFQSNAAHANLSVNF